MTFIVLAVVGAVLLLPAGLILIFFSRKHHGASLAGIGCLVLFVLARPLWTDAWPFDWFIPGSETRVSAEVRGYRIDFVQRPGGDFYWNRFEIFQPDGKMATVSLAVDDGKCWRPSVVETSEEVQFTCVPAGVAGAINTNQMYVISGNCSGQRCRFSAMLFK